MDLVQTTQSGGNVKEMKVVLGQGAPQFTFTGEWTGHNVMAVYNNLKRAYHLYNRTTRRAVSLKDIQSIADESAQQSATVPVLTTEGV